MSQLRSRREILKLSVVAAGAVPVACYKGGDFSPPLSPEQSAEYFPQSVASGDPRPNSVVLWVRVEDAYRSGESLPVELELGLDPGLTQLLPLQLEAQTLFAAVEADHCLRVRVDGLEPGTTYYYRFAYLAQQGLAYSRIGRTRTAPAPDADVPVRFGVVCCQDYDGRYYHVHRHLAAQELDFVLHLGDYVYESVGDPAFQSPTDERAVRFSAPDEALEVGRGQGNFLAAQSLSNYRDLYKIYRGDPDLQALHERHPIVAIWDDHEFSDDCHGDVATYEDGRADEASPARRAAADQAWFEYMPVDYDGMPAARFDPAGEFPDNFSIYRGFVFGRHLELVATDLRRFRPDHLVPEDAPPGVVFMEQAELEEELGALPEDAVPYVEIDSYAGGAYQDALRDAAEELDITPRKLTGNISAVWINQALAGLSGDDLPEPIDLEDASLERGYAYHCLLKTSEFSRLGSRYLLAKQPLDALAARRFRESDGKSERLMGDAQRDWFLKTLRDSTRTFKVWASEIAVLPRLVDLTGVVQAPPELRTRFSISGDDWDGFPNERRALLTELAKLDNVVVLSGDLHCFFAGTPFVEGAPEARVVELLTGSASSTTWLDAIQGGLTQDASLPMEVQLLVQLVGELLSDKVRRPNPHLAFQELGRNGYSVIQAGGDELSMSLYMIDPADVAKPAAELDEDLDAVFSVERFRTRAGTKDLEREVEGEFRTWDLERMEFV